MNLGIESETLEFKKSTGEIEKAVDNIASMLNKHGHGTLFFGVAPDGNVTGQQISAKSLSSLRFVPASGCRESSFRFRAAGDYSIPCLLRYTDESNAAPVAAKPSENAGDAVACWTQQDIAVWDTLEGSDPEGDALFFEIADYPKNGLIELTDAARRVMLLLCRRLMVAEP